MVTFLLFCSKLIIAEDVIAQSQWRKWAEEEDYGSKDDRSIYCQEKKGIEYDAEGAGGRAGSY